MVPAPTTAGSNLAVVLEKMATLEAKNDAQNVQLLRMSAQMEKMATIEAQNDAQKVQMLQLSAQNEQMSVQIEKMSFVLAALASKMPTSE